MQGGGYFSRVGKFYFMMDFLVLEMGGDIDAPIILERPSWPQGELS